MDPDLWHSRRATAAPQITESQSEFEDEVGAGIFLIVTGIFGNTTVAFDASAVGQNGWLL
jgi:hypothetical protein